MDKLIAGEAVAATEAGAIAASRLMGRGDREGADHAAVEAMRRAMEESEISGTIVIGEGERDEAPMLYIGEKVGNPEAAVEVDIAVDPLEGNEPGRHRLGERHRRAGRGGARRTDARPGHVHEQADRGAAGGGPRLAGRPGRQDDPHHRRTPRPRAMGHHRRHPGPATPRAADRRRAGHRRADQADQRRRPDRGHHPSPSPAPACTR